jgi:UDP:flavonoid glycosyltransferase YjiC (YdhE family)
MANIVFIMLPEKGHIISSLKLAKSLKARGHRVYYLQLPEFKEYICSHGLEFIPTFERSFPKRYELSHHLSTLENLRAWVDMEADTYGLTFESLMKKEYGDIRDKLDGISAHLLIQDLYSPIVYADLEIEIPYVLLNPTIIYPSVFRDSKREIPESRPLMLTLCPEQFELPHPKRPAQVHYVEASIDFDRKGQGFQWDMICESKRLIYCSLGTQSHWSYGNTDHKSNQQIRKNFLQTVINAISNYSKWQLILWLGDYMHPKDFHSVPSNVLLVNNAPQIEILERASLMITHGGLNSVKECIFLGVPMIVFPLVGDQFKNADCVVFHQLGLKGDIENVSEGLIRSLIDEIANNPVFIHKMKKMKKIFRRAENSGRAVTMIESVLNQAK